ncbi:MAG TPA: arginase [Cryomorphaceae bacterium]|nr:arginase [Owenweeksia sp.]MBF98943.1 arginase [Owenweeksia sp.]HAD97550.1 arginase [Cryomorphaceae bacterium]HBF19912.1 arginase [Cryomorphaceae bacterium]|tara:strand:+ start:21697 stop:22644 length:948 start_codon:yes stop_codon:yes gene_type:complete
MSKKLQILSVMSELGAGTRGASLGFEALRMASFKGDIGFFKKYPVKRVKTLNDRLFKKSTRKFAKRLDGIEEMYRTIEKEVSAVLKNNNFPVVISGDHSNAGGTIAGIKTAYPKKRLGVIWIDAHSDLHSPYTSPSGNVHGMPLATALHDDNLENQNNQPSEETIWHWNELKGSNQRVMHSDLFFIAVRDSEEPEQELMKKHHIPNVTTDELREKGVEAVAKQAREYLKDCDILYISFDVDSMDPSISRGTGTPVPGGITDEEARNLIQHLLEDKRVCCFEMTEINPLLDDRNKMAETAFSILKATINKINKNFS